ncbi:TlpA family protein disulfide reductase [Candidatus Poribacteria bacterium]|nr:TlpA family protein disulfide reductase [Candidatus Poribacteria bacterium]
MHRLNIQIRLFFVLVLTMMACGEDDPNPTQTASVTTPPSETQTYPQAPSFILLDINRNAVSLEDFEGKVVLLNFFATWCAPCRVEIPGFIELYHKYQSQGFVVVGISTDPEGVAVVKPFVTELEIDYPVLIGDTEIFKAYRLLGLPTSLILNRQGGIRNYHVGIQPKALFEREILEVLNP